MTQANSANEIQTQVETPAIEVEVNLEKPGAIAALPPAGGTGDQQWQQIKDQVLAVLAELPAYVSSFFSEYQRPLLTLGLIAAGGISIKVLLAVVDSLNDIPLLSPTFELVGMGYTGWFVYRYLLKASTRQELIAEIDALKEQVMGKKA